VRRFRPALAAALAAALSVARPAVAGDLARAPAAAERGDEGRFVPVEGFGAEIAFTPPGAVPPPGAIAPDRWVFRRGSNDLPCQLWAPFPGGDAVVLRLFGQGAEGGSLLVGAHSRRVLPRQGDEARVVWRAPAGDGIRGGPPAADGAPATGRGALVGVTDDGSIGVARVGPGGMAEGDLIRVLSMPSRLTVEGHGFEASLPPVPPALLLVLAQCLADRDWVPPGTLAHVRPARAPDASPPVGPSSDVTGTDDREAIPSPPLRLPDPPARRR